MNRVRNALRRLERALAVYEELAAVREEVDAVVLVGALRVHKVESEIEMLDVLELDVLGSCRAVDAQHAVREPELGNGVGERIDAAYVYLAAIHYHLAVLRQTVVDLRTVRNVHFRALADV